MIVVQHNIDMLDRSLVGWLEAGDGGKQVTVRDLPAARAHRRARARAAHRRAVLQVIPAPPTPRTRTEARTMLVMQRPTVEAIGEEPKATVSGSPSARSSPASATRSATRLRRTLLSSIPGAAITQVRFDDALHEFDTITGVTEDVTDIILNLKDIVAHVARPTSRSRCASTSRGPADVTAGDIECPADVEILNQDLAHRHAQRQGPPGHRPHRRAGPRLPRRATATTENRTIGVIPVDAIFSPVRRVTFEVEPTRVEQATNYDRLVLDIETDGSITPARGAGLGRRHAALARRPGRRR